MKAHAHTPPNLQLLVAPGTIRFFATVLQSGIEVQARSGEKLGAFLDRLPGFSHDYIIEAIQTIFLNGTAIDDLETQLEGERPVLALSAAMPGLAGAIFRKNSFHAALRTTVTDRQVHCREQSAITVILKLFNSIAKDCGPTLLAGGVLIKAASLLTFFETSPTLLSHLRRIEWDGREMACRALTDSLARNGHLNLTVNEAP